MQAVLSAGFMIAVSTGTTHKGDIHMKKLALVMALIMAMLSVTTAWAEITVSMDTEQAYAYALELREAGKKDEALAIFSQLAMKGHAMSMVYVGYAYLHGEGVVTSPALAEQYYLQAANAGEAEAMKLLGYGYKNGTLGEVDFAKALEWYTKGAELGDSGCMNNLGLMYARGEGVEKDVQRAAELYLAAAEKGSVPAMGNIGAYFFNGTHQEKDYVQAEKWLAKAVENGSTSAFAYTKLADIYFYGYVTGTPDYAKAQPLYEKASADGDQAASTQLGNIYYQGYGVEQDIQKADEYFTLASEQGNSHASVYIADRCLEGKFPGGAERAESMYLLVLVDEEASAEAADKLITLYLEGAKLPDGTVLAEPDLDKALEVIVSGKGSLAVVELAADKFEAIDAYEKEQQVLLRAMELGCSDPSKIYDLADIYYRGRVTGTPDYAAAKPLLEKASDLGEANASTLLCGMYNDGLGVEKDPAMYEKYLILACEQGNANAYGTLGNAYYHGWLTEGVNAEKALIWYQHAIDADKMAGYEGMGRMYANGVKNGETILLAADYAKAFPLLEKAYEMGSKNGNVLAWLGYFYKGNDTAICAQDYAKALGVFTMGAEAGDNYCMYQLGLMYVNGEGVVSDYLKAEAWFTKALEGGYAPAQEWLDWLATQP